MKKMLLLVLSVMSLGVFAKINGSLKFVPSNADGVICIDVAKGVKSSALTEIRKENSQADASFVEVENELKKYNLRIEDVAKDLTAFVSMKGVNGAIITSGITPDVLDRMVKDGMAAKMSEDAKVDIQKIGGKTVYVVSAGNANDVDPIPGFQTPDKTALTFLDKDRILITDLKDLSSILDSLKVSNMDANSAFKTALKEVNTSAMVWMLFNIPVGIENPQFKDVDSVSVSLDFCETQKDVDINACVRCKSEQFAQQLTQQAKMMLMMAGGMAFQDDPQLAMDVTSALKISNNAKDVKLKFNIPKPLQDRLKAFAEKKNAEKSVPAATPTPAPVMN
ncbi:MAG: hypothetical protein JXR78_17300 [Victivallales bacterium]|nr:hypothetical protein [Victivallales bacterium]